MDEGFGDWLSENRAMIRAASRAAAMRYGISCPDDIEDMTSDCIKTMISRSSDGRPWINFDPHQGTKRTTWVWSNAYYIGMKNAEKLANRPVTLELPEMIIGEVEVEHDLSNRLQEVLGKMKALHRAVVESLLFDSNTTSVRERAERFGRSTTAMQRLIANAREEFLYLWNK